MWRERGNLDEVLGKNEPPEQPQKIQLSFHSTASNLYSEIHCFRDQVTANLSIFHCWLTGKLRQQGGEYISPSLGLTSSENKEAGRDGALEDDRRAAYRRICRRAAADSGTDMTYRFAD